MSDRPIVSSCNSATENISRFIHTYLQPAVKQLPSYIKDTKDFVLFIESLQIPKDTILVTLDISSLYTNIPHDEGTLYAKQAYSQIFVRHTHMPHPNAIHKLMNIVLKNNLIRFADKCYLQIRTGDCNGNQNGTELRQPIHGQNRTTTNPPQNTLLETIH